MDETTKVALWEAINRYAQSCGGDTSEVTANGNIPRMDAVVDVEKVIDGALRSLRDELHNIVDLCYLTTRDDMDYSRNPIGAVISLIRELKNENLKTAILIRGDETLVAQLASKDALIASLQGKKQKPIRQQRDFVQIISTEEAHKMVNAAVFGLPEEEVPKLHAYINQAEDDANAIAEMRDEFDDGQHPLHSVKELLLEQYKSRSLFETLKEEIKQLKAQLSAAMQATECAACGVYKHTPVRRDSMGGYVCGGCLEKRIDELEAMLPHDPSQKICFCGHWAGGHTTSVTEAGAQQKCSQCSCQCFIERGCRLLSKEEIEKLPGRIGTTKPIDLQRSMATVLKRSDLDALNDLLDKHPALEGAVGATAEVNENNVVTIRDAEGRVLLNLPLEDYQAMVAVSAPGEEDGQ